MLLSTEIIDKIHQYAHPFALLLLHTPYNGYSSLKIVVWLPEKTLLHYTAASYNVSPSKLLVAKHFLILGKNGYDSPLSLCYIHILRPENVSKVSKRVIVPGLV